jgi:hypothetical protein
MGYSSQGRRSPEYASRSSHTHIINDPTVQKFINACQLPKQTDDIHVLQARTISSFKNKNPICHVIAVDGGYTTAIVQKKFPSSELCFFQFGALFFSIEDLESIEHQAFIDPEDMAKLKSIQRLKLAIPLKNMALKNEMTLTHSVRRAIYDFFVQNPEDDADHLIDSLSWLIFEKFETSSKETWILARCPSCNASSIPLIQSEMTSNHTFICKHCKSVLYLTDVLRLHEAIDDIFGASGIISYLATTIEQLLLVHLIKLILQQKPALLNEILFLKDGPLAFFGQTANLHKPMRALISFLLNKHNLFMVGLEKSGAFVDHANEISDKLMPNSALLVNNEYIYTYIIPGKASPDNAYGRTTYYGSKVIYKTSAGSVYVVTVPTSKLLLSPEHTDLKNLDCILNNIEKLHCDMYDNALVPIALANKLVSLANHPSSRILQKFAKQGIL